MNKFLVFFAAIVLSAQVYAQEKGFLRGNIADGDFGGPMIGATVTVAELPGVGAVTDFDGNYSLPLDPGVYTVQIAFISYGTQKYEGVEIKSGDVTMIDAVMTSAIEELTGIEVVAEVRRNSEAAMLMDMKSATSVTDGLSAQSFRKIGDSDLSGAIKRVTGVTVQSGKYVYVRGLGDRYTKTTLNGMALPGLDPDVNAVQIDIFPTSILENVAVSKTFAPDLDGDFTGGLVNVVTKNFPDEKTSQLSVGATFVPSMHFNSDFILYDRKPTAFTGFDFGQRQLPFDPYMNRGVVPDPITNDPLQEEITRSFSPQMAAKNKTAYPNGSFSFNHGNQINKESGTTVGYNLVFNYSNENVFYKDFQSNDYLRNFDKSENELFKQVSRVGDVGKNNVLWSALASGAIKKNGNSVSLTLLNSLSSETAAAQRVNQDFNQNQATLIENVLTYSQRQLTSGIINGKHKLGRVELNWANALSYSNVYDPDFRETRISVTDGDTTLSTGNGSGLFRFWRDLTEWNNSSKVDANIQVAEKAFIKVGGLATFKAREFTTFSYKHTRRNLSDISFDPDWYLQEENIWSPEGGGGNVEGTYTIGTYQPANSFDASQSIFSGYAMANHRLFSFIKLVYGVRVEQTAMYYTGTNNTGTVRYNNEKTLDNLNFLPSANMVVELSEKMNLRAGANQTLARPSFKEKSIAQIYDPITKRTFIGNIDLEQTQINNFDLRYEYFISGKELFAVSAFYKQFDGHIELVSFATAPDNLKPRNSGEAETYGVEVELRKGLPNVESSVLSRFFLSTNVSLVQSRVDMNTVFVNNTGLTEKELRENNKRDNETIGNYRPMSGQSPYAVNVALSYEDIERQMNVSLAYNVQGEQLTIIASGRVPDIYTIPFHSLNFNAYKSLGVELNHRVTFGVQNILNDDRTLVYRSFDAKEGIYTTFKPGVGISLKYQYTF